MTTGPELERRHYNLIGVGMLVLVLFLALLTVTELWWLRAVQALAVLFLAMVLSVNAYWFGWWRRDAG
jgi:hypothetical protein